jgi:hypothetical protein
VPIALPPASCCRRVSFWAKAGKRRPWLMQAAIAPLRPMVPQFLPLSGQIEPPGAGRWHTLHPISFASRLVPHAGPIIDGRRSPDKWRAPRLGSQCGSEPCSLGRGDNPRRQSDRSSRLMTVMVSPPLPSDPVLPTISTSALGQIATWPAGGHTSAMNSEPDPCWPSWFVANVPGADLRIGSQLHRIVLTG